MVLSCAAIFAQNATKDEIQCRALNADERGTRAAADWGTFTNFTATDMNGVSHNIQSYLDQGKYVVIDFFCAWCGPCWSLHRSGRLEQLYNQYGQGAENGDMIILMCETQTSNTAAQITGTDNSGSASTDAEYYASASQGDFTDGGHNPIPIIDATSNFARNVSLYEGYVPSVYMFCPSGYVCDIYSGYLSASSSTSAATVAGRIHDLLGSCPEEDDLPLVDINKPEIVRMGESANFTSKVISISSVTSYSWTFEGGTPATANTASVSVVWDQVGSHNVSLTITNENGSTTENAVVDVIDCTIGISEFPYNENFENGQGCWLISSADPSNDDALGFLEYSEGMFGMVFSSYNRASNYNQYLISRELIHNGELDLTFKYKKGSSNSTGEKFYVKYSTTDTNISSFTTLGSMVTATSTSWTNYSGVLPANTKYFMINYNTNYQYYLFVDNLKIEANHENDPSFIEGAVANEISVFPNPTTGIVNIAAEGLTNVSVYDVTGREVMSLGAESTIDISELEAGVYFVNVATENGSAMKRIVKE